MYRYSAETIRECGEGCTRNGLIVTLGVGSYCTVRVTFRPTSAGPKTAEVRFEAGDSVRIRELAGVIAVRADIDVPLRTAALRVLSPILQTATFAPPTLAARTGEVQRLMHSLGLAAVMD